MGIMGICRIPGTVAAIVAWKILEATQQFCEVANCPGWVRGCFAGVADLDAAGGQPLENKVRI